MIIHIVSLKTPFIRAMGEALIGTFRYRFQEVAKCHVLRNLNPDSNITEDASKCVLSDMICPVMENPVQHHFVFLLN